MGGMKGCGAAFSKWLFGGEITEMVLLGLGRVEIGGGSRPIRDELLPTTDWCVSSEGGGGGSRVGLGGDGKDPVGGAAMLLMSKVVLKAV